VLEQPDKLRLRKKRWGVKVYNTAKELGRKEAQRVYAKRKAAQELDRLMVAAGWKAKVTRSE